MSKYYLNSIQNGYYENQDNLNDSECLEIVGNKSGDKIGELKDYNIYV